MFVIVYLKQCALACPLVAALVVAGVHELSSQNQAVLWGISPHDISAQSLSGSRTPPLYETRANHDPNGTGKFYMGREIAQVMGPGGIEWLDRREREEGENPPEGLEFLDFPPGEVCAC